MPTVITRTCIVILLIRTEVLGNGVKHSYFISGTNSGYPQGGVLPVTVGVTVPPLPLPINFYPRAGCIIFDYIFDECVQLSQ